MCSQRHLRSAERNLLHVPRHRDSTGTAASGLLPLLVRPPGTVFRTLSAIRTPPKLLSCACQKHFYSHGTSAPSALGRGSWSADNALYINRHIDNDIGGEGNACFIGFGGDGHPWCLSVCLLGGSPQYGGTHSYSRPPYNFGSVGPRTGMPVRSPYIFTTAWLNSGADWAV